MNVEIKNTSTQPEGAKLLSVAAAGSIAYDVDVKRAPNGKLVAYVDDKPIGFLKVNAEELPEVYNLQIIGVSDTKPNTFIAELKTTQTKKTNSSAKGIDDQKERIISEGIMEEPELDLRIKNMQDNNVPASVIEDCLALYKKYVTPVHRSSVMYMPIDGISHMPQFLMSVTSGVPVRLEGPKSTGKTVLTGTCAQNLGMPLYSEMMDINVMLETLVGSKTFDTSAADKLGADDSLAVAALKVRLKPDDATDEEWNKAAEFEVLRAQGASFKFTQEQTSFSIWAMDGGCLFLDEMNTANQNVLVPLVNSLADTRRTLIIPGQEGITLNDHCIICGAMNSGSEYKGRTELDMSLKSRFGTILMYEPNSIIDSLKPNFTEDTCLTKKQFKSCDDVYQSFRKAVRGSGNRMSDEALNIRGFVNALKIVEKYPDATTLATQIEKCVVDACPSDEAAVLNPILHDLLGD